jgi:uncharacterized protein (DUF779 family)
MYFSTKNLVLVLATIASIAVAAPTIPFEVFNTFDQRGGCCSPSARACCARDVVPV